MFARFGENKKYRGVKATNYDTASLVFENLHVDFLFSFQQV